ncbi:hypothetical protein Tco_1452871 [Tanacetum coccineum]
MEKDPATPLLIGRGFLATASAVMDCRKAKIAVREGVTRLIFGVKEINLGDKKIPYWTTLGSMWESEELIKKKTDWNRPPKEGDSAWHIRIKLFDHDREKFKKTL